MTQVQVTLTVENINQLVGAAEAFVAKQTSKVTSTKAKAKAAAHDEDDEDDQEDDEEIETTSDDEDEDEDQDTDEDEDGEESEEDEDEDEAPPKKSAKLKLDDVAKAAAAHTKRHGNRKATMKVLAAFNVKSINELKADKYAAVIAKLKK